MEHATEPCVPAQHVTFRGKDGEQDLGVSQFSQTSLKPRHISGLALNSILKLLDSTVANLYFSAGQLLCVASYLYGDRQQACECLAKLPIDMCHDVQVCWLLLLNQGGMAFKDEQVYKWLQLSQHRYMYHVHTPFVLLAHKRHDRWHLLQQGGVLHGIIVSSGSVPRTIQDFARMYMAAFGCLSFLLEPQHSAILSNF